METADRPVSEARPIGIYIVLVLLTTRAIQLGASLLPVGQSDVLQWLGTISAIPPYPVETAVGVAVRVAVVGLLIGTVIAIVGMLRGQHWGWTMAVITTGFILAVDLGWWWSGEPRYLTMAASAVAVFYLNQRDVQVAFEDHVAFEDEAP